jgi:hypothetical protein
MMRQLLLAGIIPYRRWFGGRSRVSSSDLIRWSGLAAILAGVGLISDILFKVALPDLLAALLMVVGLLGLHTVQKDDYGWIGRVGFWTVVVGSLGQVLGVTVFWLGSAALIWLASPVGFVAVPIGLMLYGIATLQARALPRWCGLGLIIIPPITLVLGDNYGSALLGLLWLALGYVLWSWKRTAAGLPSRVS